MFYCCGLNCLHDVLCGIGVMLVVGGLVVLLFWSNFGYAWFGVFLVFEYILVLWCNLG